MLSVADVAEATNGLLDAPHRARDRVTGVSIDTRTLAAGDLFVALRGENADGHDFVDAAAAAGASALLVQRDVTAGGTGRAVPVVRVADTLSALADLARSAHRRMADEGTLTVAITGSAGKTTTKDLTAHVLEGHDGRPGPVVAPPGSFNNDIGLPLTVARAGAGGEPPSFLVLEMGARGAGHITRLCEVARPDVGVVLMIGSAHLSEFGSRDGIARAKAEIVEALDLTGVAVLNADDPLVAAMADRTRAQVVTFGVAPAGSGPGRGGADVLAAGVELDAEARACFDLVAPDGRAPVRLPVPGAHMVTNALAAATVAVVAGMDVRSIAQRLSTPGRTSPHRMAVTERPDGVTVIDDAYNASPEAVVAALRVLSATAAGGRRWAVLGEMRELGDHAAEAHREAGRAAAGLGIDRVVVVGEAAAGIHEGFTAADGAGRSDQVPDVASAEALLAGALAPGDVVLLKASNSVALWRLGDRLARGTAAAS